MVAFCTKSGPSDAGHTRSGCWLSHTFRHSASVCPFTRFVALSISLDHSLLGCGWMPVTLRTAESRLSIWLRAESISAASLPRARNTIGSTTGGTSASKIQK